MEGIRRSKRIAAARSMTVVAEDPTISNMEQRRRKELMLLARACATRRRWRTTTRILEVRKVKTLTLRLTVYQDVVQVAHLRTTWVVIKERFYEYPKKVVALLELGYLKELEQGVFLRIPTFPQRELHPDLSKLARKLQEEQREQETFEKLLDDCQLFALGNDIFCDETFHQTTQTRRQATRTVRNQKPHTAID